MVLSIPAQMLGHQAFILFPCFELQSLDAGTETYSTLSDPNLFTV